jgi:hypothetical protein
MRRGYFQSGSVGGFLGDRLERGHSISVVLIIKKIKIENKNKNKRGTRLKSLSVSKALQIMANLTKFAMLSNARAVTSTLGRTTYLDNISLKLHLT